MMYWRSFIREGDTVTPAGGRVQPSAQPFPITYDGKLGYYEGDPVYCNACRSWGRTQCVSPYRPHTDSLGRQANLDGDLCLCGCPTPPRLKALVHTDRMGFDEREIAAMPAAVSWLIHEGHKVDDHEIVYEVVDMSTGAAVAGMRYSMRSGVKDLVQDQPIREGRSEPVLLNDHPHVTFIAWMAPVRR